MYQWFCPYSRGQKIGGGSTSKSYLARSRNKTLSFILLHVSACVILLPKSTQIHFGDTDTNISRDAEGTDGHSTNHSELFIHQNDFDADAVTSTIKMGQMAHLNANRSLFLSEHICGYWTSNQVNLLKRVMNQILHTDRLFRQFQHRIRPSSLDESGSLGYSGNLVEF